MGERISTEKDSIEYIKKGGDIEKVPHIFINEKLCNLYMKAGGKISKIPQRFITQNMCNKYIEDGGPIEEVPKKYIHKELCDNYIELGGDIVNVPEEFVNQKLCKLYIKKGGNISAVNDIDKRFIDDEMVNDYVENTKDLEFIPEKYITKKISDYVWEYAKEIKFIPEKYITKKMSEEYIEDGGKLVYVPEKHITEKMIKTYLDKGGSILSIPPKLITIEMIDNSKEIKKVDKFNNTTQKEIVLRILMAAPKAGLSKEEIIEKYRIAPTVINPVLKELTKSDKDSYDRITKSFDKNKNEEIININTEYAEEIVDIFKSLGPIKERLSKDQRVQFTYLLETGNIKNSIYYVYDFIADQKKKTDKSRTFLALCKRYLGFRFRNMTSNDNFGLFDENEFLMEKGAKWFTKFNRKEYFVDNTGKPKKHYFLDNNNNTVEITEEDLDLILKYLKTKRIPQNDCIVKEACARHVKGELDIFCDELKSGEYLEKIKEEKNRIK